MKKILLPLVLCFYTASAVNAQKKIAPTSATIVPNNGVAKLLPDLTFSLIPALSAGGNGYEPVPGVPGKIKIPISFIVKNIGNATAKPCKVEVEILYPGPRTHAEVEQGVPAGAYNRGIHSESVPVEAIEKGKDILKNYAFIFSNFPDEAWGKRVKIIARIIYPIYNGEISNTNNSSNSYEFDLVK